MNFHPIEGSKLKVRILDHKHRVKRTNKPRRIEPKKTQLPVSEGKRKVPQWLSDDRMYKIFKLSAKFKTYRRLVGPVSQLANPSTFDNWKMLGGATTLEQAIEWAVEDAEGR